MSGPDQLSMLHRLPSARVVDRLEHLTALGDGQRVVHIGFVDAGYQEMQTNSGTWLHARLAKVTTSLVGIDVDGQGVETARAEGFEAYTADCREPAEVTGLGLEPADLVIAGEVIEHLDAPGAFLDAMTALVRPGGRLVLTTPNASGLGNTVAALGGYEINHPDHVTLFSCVTLSTLLGRHGWDVVSTATYVPVLKPIAGRVLLAAGGRAMLWFERTAARLGAPFVADGLIVEARSTRV